MGEGRRYFFQQPVLSNPHGVFVLHNLAALIFVYFKYTAPVRSAPVRSASDRFAPNRSALERFAPERFALERFAPWRFAPLRSTPERSAPDRSQSGQALKNFSLFTIKFSA